VRASEPRVLCERRFAHLFDTRDVARVHSRDHAGRFREAGLAISPPIALLIVIKLR